MQLFCQFCRIEVPASRLALEATIYNAGQILW
jgi:hypothetical protein